MVTCHAFEVQGVHVRAMPVWFVMLVGAPRGSTTVKVQDQFRLEARAALLSLLTGAAEESGATLRDIAARLGQGVTSCRTWAELGSSGPGAMVAGGGAEGQGLGAEGQGAMEEGVAAHVHVYEMLAAGCQASLQGLTRTCICVCM